jgi:segregation and condensation protein B
MLTPPAAIEALLFVSGEPLGKKTLAKLLDIDETKLNIALDVLKKIFTNRGVALVDNGSEVELRTAPEAAPLLQKLRESELSRDLGKAGLETFAVIAYRAGSTRSEIDWVRGVNSSTSIRTLLIRGLIEGEEDAQDRRKIRYRVTTNALAHLGVRSTSDLPRYEELSAEATMLAETAHVAQEAEITA